MKPEILAEIQRRSAEHKRMIASGELQVCSTERPMPEDRDIMGQHWFHENAKAESTLGDNADGSKNRIYHCPTCGLRFPVTLSKIVLQDAR